MCITSIFVDKGMDWKLGGFEFLIGTAELDEGYVNNLKELLPKKYQSPELARQHPSTQANPRGRRLVRARLRPLRAPRPPIRPPAPLPPPARRTPLPPAIPLPGGAASRSLPPPARPEEVEVPEALRPAVRLAPPTAGRLRPIEMLQNPLFDEEYVSLQLFLETCVRLRLQPPPRPEPSPLTHAAPLTPDPRPPLPRTSP